MIRIIIMIFSVSLLFPSVNHYPADKQKYLRSLEPGGTSMIHIPAGEYFTGEKDYGEKSPLIKKAFKSFYIDIHPVTNSQYLKFMERTGYLPQGQFNKNFAKDNPYHPVTGITLEDASKYAEFSGKRLPTEWEWEISARGLKENYQTFLSNIYKEKKGIFFRMDRKKTSPVFSTPPNNIGLYDHIGNIFEWTTGVYPKDELIGKYRDSLKLGIIRGGSWTNIRNDIKYSTRTPFPVGRSLQWLGFRCVKDPKK